MICFDFIFRAMPDGLAGSSINNIKLLQIYETRNRTLHYQPIQMKMSYYTDFVQAKFHQKFKIGLNAERVSIGPTEILTDQIVGQL